MSDVLFVTNGHGEIAIADRIAAELHDVAPNICIDHVALVGDVRTRHARDVGPRKSMPSGGLIAMGNVPAVVRDLRAGLASLTIRQWRFLKGARGRYAVVIAVGDAFALAMAARASSPVLYVGTAKSVLVAPYGPGERRLLRRARAVFVRDEATAEDLRRTGIPAEAPGNVIVDLFSGGDDAGLEAAVEDFRFVVALLPGSREPAYADAAFLTDTCAAAAKAQPGLGGILSIAPGIDVRRMESTLQAQSHVVEHTTVPFVPFYVVHEGHVVLRAWSGDIGPVLRRAAVALGQAGTANEAAAAAGIPVLAVARRRGWYRHRQAKLLGEALTLLDADVETAARELVELARDERLRASRGAVGKARMGAPGGARRIAERIAQVAYA